MKRGFSQRQLCEYFGWNYREVAPIAKLQGLSTQAYVHETGIILNKDEIV